MRSLFSTLLAFSIPCQIIASHSSTVLGVRTVTVQSNETLRSITEFNHTTKYLEWKLAANAANTTIDQLVESQLALEFDVCFPSKFCPKVTANLNLFEEAFENEVCAEYCDETRFSHTLEVLSVCQDGGHTNYADSGCIDFGLSLQASSKAEAMAVKKELGASIVSSKPVWRALLREIAPEFDNDITETGILGYYISQDNNETWYPAWDDGQELCKNDAPPFYMKLDPNEYLFPTMTDCCRKHYWWNVRGCAEPENRPCPEGYVPTDEQITREGIFTGKYFGKYPNIFYSGCIPKDGARKLELEQEKQDNTKEEEDASKEEELHHREQEALLGALLKRQERLEKFMPPVNHRPPVEGSFSARRLVTKSRM